MEYTFSTLFTTAWNTDAYGRAFIGAFPLLFIELLGFYLEITDKVVEIFAAFPVLVE